MLMGIREVFHFELLGAFSCGSTEEEKTKNSELINGMGKKVRSFLQYLIVNHTRSVSSEELIDQFWADNSRNPANALRNMLFKARQLLREMFPEGEDMLLTLQDCYSWNPAIRLSLDVEEFEELCVRAREEAEEERCSLLRQAVALYGGEFLAGNDAEWARTQRQYYQTLYLDSCKAVLPLLHKKGQFVEVISICSHAYAVDFSMEDFTAYQMEAHIALGQPGQAMEKYRAFKERMQKELGMQPPERIEQLYTLADGLRKKGMDDEDILRLVCEEEPDGQAFFCTFSTFQSIVALEKRHIRRSGEAASLVIISLESERAPTTDSRRMEHILMEKLRTGDPIARLEAGSYIFMLTGACVEDARIVAGRIDSAFHRTYRHSKARLTFQVTDLKPYSRAEESSL